MIKAAKEAKVHTSWLTPNQPYEDAIARFVEPARSRGAGRTPARHVPAVSSAAWQRSA